MAMLGALAHAAAQLMRIAAEAVRRDADQPQQFARALSALAPRHLGPMRRAAHRRSASPSVMTGLSAFMAL